MRLATRLALEERGDHLSPKYIPQIILAPTISKSIFPLLAIAIKDTPIVLAEPKELPKKNATRLLIKKENKII